MKKNNISIGYVVASRLFIFGIILCATASHALAYVRTQAGSEVYPTWSVTAEVSDAPGGCVSNTYYLTVNDSLDMVNYYNGNSLSEYVSLPHTWNFADYSIFHLGYLIGGVVLHCNGATFGTTYMEGDDSTPQTIFTVVSAPSSGGSDVTVVNPTSTDLFHAIIIFILTLGLSWYLYD